jgi:transketolase
MGWHRWVGTQGVVVGISRFGASAPAKTVFKELGISPENVAHQARALLGRADASAGPTAGKAAAGPAKLGVDERNS